MSNTRVLGIEAAMAPFEITDYSEKMISDPE